MSLVGGTSEPPKAKPSKKGGVFVPLWEVPGLKEQIEEATRRWWVGTNRKGKPVVKTWLLAVLEAASKAP